MMRTEASRRTFVGEWMRTGDIYTRDDDGYYTYLGRADDMFKVGGEWVSPAEVEATLAECPGVLEAAVVARRDDDGLSKAVAFVVRTKSHQAARDGFVRSMTFSRAGERAVELDARAFGCPAHEASGQQSQPARACRVRAGGPDHDRPDDVEERDH